MRASSVRTDGVRSASCSCGRWRGGERGMGGLGWSDVAFLRLVWREVEDALYDSAAFRSFVGIDLGSERAPDATTLLKFRRLLEQHQLGEALMARVNAHLKASGVRCDIEGWRRTRTACSRALRWPTCSSLASDCESGVRSHQPRLSSERDLISAYLDFAARRRIASQETGCVDDASGVFQPQ